MAGVCSKGKELSGAKKRDIDGIIREAMAWRVKYRLTYNGKAKRRLQIQTMGVHPTNRGGVYPNEDKVMSLGQHILKCGADQDEADHNGVCVEEIPEVERQNLLKYSPQLRVDRLERYGEYNQRQCAQTDALKTCFASGGNVLYGNLSHNHLLLVLLCWATGAKWDLQDDGKPFCNNDGCLDISAVADAEKDPVLVGLVTHGLLMETLSWKMLVEEPEAASLISQALNKGQGAALRTSELTALAVLTGAVTLLAEGNKAREVEYKTIQEKVRAQLDVYVDEPEFIEMFECVIGLGAGQNGYMKELLEFGARFVNSEFRQLRLCAFTAVNKMPARCPRAKLAVLKRAYRKKPVYGYCPSPEFAWAKFSEEDLLDLEHLLNFFTSGAATQSRPRCRRKSRD